jgi:hypothetical protein
MSKISAEEEMYDFDGDGKLDPMEEDEMWNDWSDSSKPGSRGRSSGSTDDIFVSDDSLDFVDDF